MDRLGDLIVQQRTVRKGRGALVTRDAGADGAAYMLLRRPLEVRDLLNKHQEPSPHHGQLELFS
jgi:hypothetical protein